MAANVGSEGRCALSPPPQRPSSSILPLEDAVRVRAKVGGDGSTSGGSQQGQNTFYLSATPSAASRPSPTLRSITSHLLELCCTTKAWTAVAGRGCFMLHLAAWRNLPVTKSCLSLPLHNNAILDARQVVGGVQETALGGRCELRGGLTAHNPPPPQPIHG